MQHILIPKARLISKLLHISLHFTLVQSSAASIHILEDHNKYVFNS
jgi:hypothetical protein